MALVNAGFWLDGCEASATDTPEADPFTVQTCTTKAAFCPRWTVDCERWTLTHSSGDPTYGPCKSEGDAACGDEPDGEGDAVVAWLEALVGLVADAEGAGEVAEAEALGAVLGEGDDEDVGEVDGDGVGEGVGGGAGEDGSTWQLVLVSAAARALDVAATSLSVPASAVLGKLACTPKVRKPPASRLSPATRTCAKRIRIALSALLVRVILCSLCDSEATGWRMGMNIDITLCPASYAPAPSRSRPGAALTGQRPRPCYVTIPVPGRSVGGHRISKPWPAGGCGRGRCTCSRIIELTSQHQTHADPWTSILSLKG